MFGENMVDYEGVEDTLFIPLTARINISKKFPEYFYDEEALKLENIVANKLIEEKSSEYHLLASVARYYNFDEITQKFINKNTESNIINLGVGLETSYFRLDSKDSIFYEVDLPEVIKLRRDLIGENENEFLISGDLFKIGWMERIDKFKPTLIIASGVFQYFHEEEIIKIIKLIQENFDNAEIIFDATNRNGLKFANRYVQKTGNESAIMCFYVNDGKEFAKKTNSTLIEQRPFFIDARKILSKKIEFMTKILMWSGDLLNTTRIIHLKLE